MNRIVLLAIVFVAIIVGYYASLPRVSIPPAVMGVQPVVKNLPPSANRSISPQLGTTISNPFAIPAGFQATDADGRGQAQQVTGGSFAAGGQSIGSAKPSTSLPVLIGVGGSGAQKIAVIHYGGKTQPYSINESIGSYKLVAVTEASATLSGSEGNITLRLGR